MALIITTIFEALRSLPSGGGPRVTRPPAKFFPIAYDEGLHFSRGQSGRDAKDERN
jgi:hypothetical protein